MGSHYLFLKLRAWSVHFYTSLGIVCAFFILTSIVRGNALDAFLWMGLANFIDSTDGTLARRWKVKLWASEFDGRKLDDIVDYINYAFLPLFLLFRFELVQTSGFGLVAMSIVLISAIYGFCQNAAKTDDGFFTGFPNYWNFLVLYLYIFRLPAEVNQVILLVCAALVFVPIKYMSFSTPGMARVNWILSGLYGLVLVAILFTLNNPPMWLVWVSLLAPVYYVATSLYLTFKTRGLPVDSGEAVH